MSKALGGLKNARETIYGTLMLITGVVLWPLIAFAVWSGVSNPNPQVASVVDVYLIYGVAIFLFYLISNAAYRALAFGNMILLGPKQFPELHTMVVSGAQQLGMKTPPTAFLFNSNGLFNAFARRLLGGRYVFLTSALVEAETDDQVRFVIGHELGHHAAGHLNPFLNFLKLPGYIIPFLQPAYSRAREYTCDSIGARLAGDVAVSRTSLLMLGCGCRRLNSTMNCEAFMGQEVLVPPIFGFLTEICRSHPRLTRRLQAMRSPR